MEPREPSRLLPAAARAMIRAGSRPETTSGWCSGYVQANLLAVPRDLAFDVLLFALRNPVACPLIDVTDPGDPCPRRAAPDADLRTDLPGYVSYRDGVAVAELHDATPLWRNDLVALLTGCSFTAESALLAAGLPMRHLDQGGNVPMYLTDRPCRSAGRISGPLVVSMRYLPAESVAKATEVTAELPLAHGAPVHGGEPHELGIRDLDKPDFGDPVSPEEGDVPVFWACGVTLQAAIMASRPGYAIGHSPGKMFITDLPVENELPF